MRLARRTERAPEHNKLISQHAEPVDCALHRQRVLRRTGPGRRGARRAWHGGAGHARCLAGHGAAVVCAVLAGLRRCRTGRIVWPKVSALAAACTRIWSCLCGRTPRAPGVGRLTQLHRPCAAARHVHFLGHRHALHVFACAVLGGSPAAGARGQRLVAAADHRPKLHRLRLCRGFLEATCFCQRQVPDGIFTVCAPCSGGTGAAGGGIRPARPHIGSQAELRPLTSLTLAARAKPRPPGRSIGRA